MSPEGAAAAMDPRPGILRFELPLPLSSTRQTFTLSNDETRIRKSKTRPQQCPTWK